MTKIYRFLFLIGLLLLSFALSTCVEAKGESYDSFSIYEILQISMDLDSDMATQFFPNENTVHLYLQDASVVLAQRTPLFVDFETGEFLPEPFTTYVNDRGALFSENVRVQEKYFNSQGFVNYWSFIMESHFEKITLLVIKLPSQNEQLIMTGTREFEKSEEFLNLFKTISFDEKVENLKQIETVLVQAPQNIAKLSVPLYQQNDPAWRCEQLGTCTCASPHCGFSNNYTIWEGGCYMVSQAMIYQYFTNSSYMNPSQYNQCLRNAGGYVSTSVCGLGYCGLPYNRTVPACTPANVSFYRYYTSTTGPLDLSILDNDLQAGYPVLVGMTGHYFVAIGKSGTDYIVNDPSWGERLRASSVIINFSLYRGHIPQTDTTKPVTDINFTGTVGENHWYKSRVTLTLTASDNSSGVAATYWSYDNSNWNSYSGPVVLQTTGLEVPVYYYSVDRAGNKEDTKTAKYNSDPFPPVNPNTINSGCSALNGIWQNTCSDPDFTWTGATDFLSGVASYEVYWGRDANAVNGTNILQPAFNPSAVAEGEVYLRIRTKDRAGNYSTWATVFTFRYDKTSPLGTLTLNNGATLTYMTFVHANLSASDSLSYVRQFRLRNNNGPWSNWQPMNQRASWILSGPTNQSQTVDVQYIDAAGNTSPVYSKSIFLNLYPFLASSSNYIQLKSTLGTAGVQSNSDNYQMMGTLTQPSIIGAPISTTFESDWGYWTKSIPIVLPLQNIYLPVINR